MIIEIKSGRTVFALILFHDMDKEIFGVYSTLAKAEEIKRRMAEGKVTAVIMPFEVDEDLTNQNTQGRV